VSSASLDTRALVLGVARRILENSSIDEGDNLFECGGDSFTGLEMCAELENELGVDISANELLTAKNFGDFATYVESLVPGSPATDAAPDAKAGNF
jgi:acyl carrier protein